VGGAEADAGTGFDRTRVLTRGRAGRLLRGLSTTRRAGTPLDRRAARCQALIHENAPVLAVGELHLDPIGRGYIGMLKLRDGERDGEWLTRLFALDLEQVRAFAADTPTDQEAKARSRADDLGELIHVQAALDRNWDLEVTFDDDLRVGLDEDVFSSLEQLVKQLPGVTEVVREDAELILVRAPGVAPAALHAGFVAAVRPLVEAE
jgi:hypothetical protein